MPTPPTILNKIKLLQKLATSPNPHEAANAQQLANKIIEKHNVSPEELESLKDAKPLYDQEQLLYSTRDLVVWRQQLALAIGTHFDTQIVQVESVPEEGPHFFEYFVYGDEEDVKKVQFVFGVYAGKVEWLITTECMGKGPVYISSYCEGAIDAIRQNIWMHGINLPEQKSKPEKVKQASAEEGLVKPKKEERPAAANKRVDVNAQSMVKDIMAYFKGLDDGSDLFLEDILEIAQHNETDH